MLTADVLELKTLIAELAPDSLLAIGPAAPEFFAEYRSQHPECRFDHIERLRSVSEITPAERYDLAFVSHTLEYLHPTAAGHLLARLRDVLARRLLVVVPIGPDWPGHVSEWNQNKMLAFGLVQVASSVHEGRPVHVYAFDIHTYKTTPDWLNARYWAHPELFGKYWW